MPISDVTLADGTTQTGLITAIQDGFGSTLKSTGIIIGLGVMMGGVLEKSGAAEKMAYSFIKLIGQKNEEWALAITGWFISIPVFADSAIVIFAPLCKAMSRVTGKVCYRSCPFSGGWSSAYTLSCSSYTRPADSGRYAECRRGNHDHRWSADFHSYADCSRFLYKNGLENRFIRFLLQTVDLTEKNSKKNTSNPWTS